MELSAIIRKIASNATFKKELKEAKTARTHDFQDIQDFQDHHDMQDNQNLLNRESEDSMWCPSVSTMVLI